MSNHKKTLLSDLSADIKAIPVPRPLVNKFVNRLIVRLKTSIWSDNRGLHSKQSLLYLRRKSQGYNIIEEDCNQIDAEHVSNSITNLLGLPDGIYQVDICDEQYDWETGHIDDYGYKLTAIVDPKDLATAKREVSPTNLNKSHNKY